MGLLTLRSAQLVAGLGLLQLLFATGLAVCGFIALGMFQRLDCKGIWLGFPMMVPGLLSILVLATRHRITAILVLATSVVILAVGAYHIYDVWDDTGYWKKYRVYAETTDKEGSSVCYDRGDHCSCLDDAEYLTKGYHVQSCDQFRTGEELFWTMIALTIGGLLFSLLNALASVWATIRAVDTVESKDKIDAPEYDMPGAKYNYQLSH